MGDGPTIGGNTYIRGKYSLPGGGKNGSFRENRWVGAGRERLREHAFGHFHQLERGQAGKDGDPQILLTPGDPGTWLAFHAGADLEDRGPPLQGIGRLLPDPGDHQGPPGGDAVLGRLVNHHPDLPGLPFSAPLEFHDDGRVRLPLRKDPRGGPPEVFGEIGGDEHLPDPQRRPHLLVISVAAHEIFLRDQREPVERLQRDDQDRQSRREGQETERLAPHGRSPLHDEVVDQDDGHGDRRGHQRPYPGIMVPPGFQPGDPALDIQPVAALLDLLRGLAGFPGVGRRGGFRRPGPVSGRSPPPTNTAGRTGKVSIAARIAGSSRQSTLPTAFSGFPDSKECLKIGMSSWKRNTSVVIVNTTASPPITGWVPSISSSSPLPLSKIVPRRKWIESRPGLTIRKSGNRNTGAMTGTRKTL